MVDKNTGPDEELEPAIRQARIDALQTRLARGEYGRGDDVDTGVTEKYLRAEIARLRGF